MESTPRLQNSRFRKAGSAVSVILECKRDPRLSPFSLAVFTLAPDLSFEYDLSLAFAKIRLFCSLSKFLNRVLPPIFISAIIEG